MSNEQPTEESELQPIPEEWQDISIDEIVEADYEVAPSPDEENNEAEQMTRYYGRHTPPGRVRNDDSIDASADDPRGTDQGYIFTGYDTEAATRIGRENAEQSEQIERFRELNEGRHQSDGNHSIREHQRDKDRLTDAICSSLPLSSLEREKVNSVVNQLDLEQFGYQKAIPRVILGTVAVVIDENHRDPVDFKDLISRSDSFRSTCRAHDISMSDLNTIKQIVRSQLDSGDVQIPLGKKIPKRDPSLPVDPIPADELPDSYWDNRSPQAWVNTARHWEELPGDIREAIPDEYQQRIEQLRQWEPWEAQDCDPENESAPGEENTEEISIEEAYDWEEIEEEAEELMSQMADEMGEEATE
jgi:hypothetical protein